MKLLRLTCPVALSLLSTHPVAGGLMKRNRTTKNMGKDGFFQPTLLREG